MHAISTVLKISAVIALGVGSAMISGCHRDDSPEVLARVGATEIRADEFAKRVLKQQSQSPVPINQRVLLQNLVDREILAQAARKAGLADDPEVLAAIDDILVSKLKERQLNAWLDTLVVADEEVRSAYDAEHEKWMSPERVRLAVLFIEKGSGPAATEAQTRISTALSLAQTTGSGTGTATTTRGFGAMAVNFSEDQETRYQGGDIGWVERSRYPRRVEPLVIEAGFALTKPGQISNVVTGTKGLYLVKLIERQSAAVRPFDEVAPSIKQRLLQSKRAQIETDFAQQLRQGLIIEMHPERLQGTPAAEPTPPPANAF